MIRWFKKTFDIEDNEWSEWKNGCIYDVSGRGRMIQYKRCRLTNKIKFRKIKIGWINDRQAIEKLKAKLNCK